MLVGKGAASTFWPQKYLPSQKTWDCKGNYDVLTDVHTTYGPRVNPLLATRLSLRRVWITQDPVRLPGWSPVPDEVNQVFQRP